LFAAPEALAVGARLHVLLRHRPPSISPRPAGCGRHGSQEYRPIPSGLALPSLLVAPS
jgi:hypothetical protein